MKKWIGVFGIFMVMSCVCGNVWAIVRQPSNSIESFEVERAYRQHSDQPADAPMAAPLPEVNRQNQPANTNSVRQADRTQNPQDIGALKAVQRDMRMQNPWYRALRVVGGSLLALGISALVIWRLWLRLVSTQRNKMLEQMRRGQQLAKELRDRRQ
ncbi:MAG: hypothetical protein ACYC1M_04285 [Armatimonadota bacterium]